MRQPNWLDYAHRRLSMWYEEGHFEDRNTRARFAVAGIPIRPRGKCKEEVVQQKTSCTIVNDYRAMRERRSWRREGTIPDVEHTRYSHPTVYQAISYVNPSQNRIDKPSALILMNQGPDTVIHASLGIFMVLHTFPDYNRRGPVASNAMAPACVSRMW